MRQLLFDTETTGLSPKSNRVVEIGIVELHNRMRTGRVFHCYLNPEQQFENGAEEVSGMTWKWLADKPRFAAIVDQLLDFIEGGEMIAHNAPFDVRFLDMELERCGLGPLHTHCKRITDTLVMARRMYQGKRNSLDAICQRLGVDQGERRVHGALIDADILANVWLAMTAGQEKMALADTLVHAAYVMPEGLPDRPRVIVLPEEQILHDKWLDRTRKIG